MRLSWADAQFGDRLADVHVMDRHVRWFRRELANGVARRLALEAPVVGALILAISLVLGSGPIAAIATSALGVPGFLVLRVGLALASNPVTSAYLLRWPHPGSTIAAVEPTCVGTATDTALKQFRFTLRGAFDEWGGAITNLYTMDSGQIVVTTSDADDVMAISALGDRRLVVTSTQMVPPHERLIVNRVESPDVRALLTSHLDLLKRIMQQGSIDVLESTMDQVVEVLAIEWDAWDQIGPVLGPFVRIGQRSQPTLLQVHVPSEEILRRTSEAKPIITARGIGLDAGPRQDALAAGIQPSPADAPPTQIDDPTRSQPSSPVPPTEIDRAA